MRRLRVHRARVAAALTVLLAGTACGGGSEPVPPFADIAGMYQLETINGASPPISLGGSDYLLEMSLTMDRDGRTIVQGYTDAVRTSDVPTFRRFFSSEGRATRSDSLIRFRNVVYVHEGTGRIVPPGMLLVSDASGSSLYVFRKP